MPALKISVAKSGQETQLVKKCHYSCVIDLRLSGRGFLAQEAQDTNALRELHATAQKNGANLLSFFSPSMSL